MANDPYAGLGRPVPAPRASDPYAGLGRPLTPVIQPAVPKRSLLEATGEAITNIPASALQYGKGLVKAVTSPVETAGTLLDIAAGALQKGAGKVLPKKAMDFIASIDNPEAAKRAMDAANQFGGQMAARYGSYDRIKNTLATDPVGFVADMSTLLSGGASATSRAATLGREAQIAARLDAIGGVTGAAAKSRAARNFARGAEVVTNRLSRAAEVTNPAIALRPVGKVAGKILEKAPPKIANIMSPKAAAYVEAAEGRGNELIQQLRRPDLEIVPGSAPTAAQAAEPLGLTKFAALGETARKILPTEYLQRTEAQEAARLRGVQTVGGTAEDLAALKKGRTQTGRQLYGNIEKNVVAVDDTFRALTQRPSMDKAMRRAAEISAEQGVPFQMGPDIRPGTMAGMPTAGRPAEYTIQSLHNLKTAMDDIIKDPATFGIGANEARVMGQTRNALVNWIESKAPGYKAARETFAKQSRRINQREVGQFLEGKLTTALPEGGERANVFGAAVKEAPTTIKRALTGESRYQQLTDLLEPHQVKAIEAVRQDLARSESARKQGRLGKEAAPGMGKLASDVGVRAPNLLNRVTAVANDIMRRLEGKIDRKLAIEIATEMLDPQAAASAVEKALVRNELAKMTGRGLKATGEAAGRAIASTPAKIGAQTQNIMTQAQNRNAMAYPPFDENGAPLLGIGNFEGQSYPIYGTPPKRK